MFLGQIRRAVSARGSAVSHDRSRRLQETNAHDAEKPYAPNEPKIRFRACNSLCRKSLPDVPLPTSLQASPAPVSSRYHVSRPHLSHSHFRTFSRSHLPTFSLPHPSQLVTPSFPASQISNPQISNHTFLSGDPPRLCVPAVQTSRSTPPNPHEIAPAPNEPIVKFQ